MDIKVDPENADVYLDGERISSGLNTDISEGNHIIKVTAKDYETEQKTIKVIANQTVNAKIYLSYQGVTGFLFRFGYNKIQPTDRSIFSSKQLNKLSDADGPDLSLLAIVSKYGIIVEYVGYAAEFAKQSFIDSQSGNSEEYEIVHVGTSVSLSKIVFPIKRSILPYAGLGYQYSSKWFLKHTELNEQRVRTSAMYWSIGVYMAIRLAKNPERGSAKLNHIIFGAQYKKSLFIGKRNWSQTIFSLGILLSLGPA